MKREIKFRAWHIATKQMLNIWPYQWQKGYYESTGAEHLFFDNMFRFSDDKKECNRAEGKSVFLSLDGALLGIVPIDELTTRSLDYSKEYEIMQFTGLKDKNGKEIFEGDIVRTGTGKNMIISWSEQMASFVIEREGWAFKHYFGEAFASNECEVIGNIYDNPELFKETEQ